jgi:hypothetical protein
MGLRSASPLCLALSYLNESFNPSALKMANNVDATTGSLYWSDERWDRYYHCEAKLGGLRESQPWGCLGG